MMLGRISGTQTADEALHSMVAEGWTTLLQKVPRGQASEFALDDSNQAAQKAWEAQVAEWRREAEVRCEALIGRRSRGFAENELDEVGERLWNLVDGFG